MLLAKPVADSSRLLFDYRRTLYAITAADIAKRYSGSAFGKLWIFLQPALLLSIYLFVYMVVFNVRFPGYSDFDYALYVFAGLIPYIGLSEGITSGCVAIKQNIHLVRNVMLPIELLPVKAVVATAVAQGVSLVILLGLAALAGSTGINVLLLPVIWLLQLAFTTGIVWVLSVLAVALPDVGYFTNLGMLLLLFISPIGFRPDMVPARFEFMVYLNPVHYMIEAYRWTVLQAPPNRPLDFVVYCVLCLGSYVVGSVFFRRFKEILADYE